MWHSLRKVRQSLVSDTFSSQRNPSQNSRSLPPDFVMLDVIDRLKVLKGPKGLVDAVTGKYDTVPLNVFLRQEIEWFQLILTIVRKTMIDMIDAIDGTISMTPDIVSSIDAVYDFRVPRNWQYDPTFFFFFAGSKIHYR